MSQTRYDRMRQRMQNYMSEVTYFDFLLDSLCGMFTWDGLPVEQRHVEEYLHCTGSVGVQASDKVPEGYLFAPDPGRDQTLDQFAEGLHVHGCTLGGVYQIDGMINEDVVICYNNQMHTPDFDLYQYANYLATVDRAILTNTKLSIFAPILCAQDSKTQKELESIIDQLLEGSVKTFKDVETEPLLQPQAQPLYSVDIANPARIANVQYQSQLWMDFLRRFFAKYGIDIQTTNKRAQVNMDEANALDAYSWMLPLDMLRTRQEFCEQARKTLGVSWSVRFSDLWQYEYSKYCRITEGDDQDDETDDDGGSADSVERGDAAGGSGDQSD